MPHREGPGHSADIDRLYYLTSHLNLDDATSERGEAVLEDWKLRVTGDSRQVR